MSDVLVVDLSKWQVGVDYVLAGEVVDAVIVKATEGLWEDPGFEGHWAGFEGLPRMAYHFFRNVSDSVEQAGRFYQTVKARGLPEIGFALDLERSSYDPDIKGQALITKVKSFLDELEELDGRKPWIYTSSGYWDDHMSHLWKYPSWCKDYPLWVANYTTAPQPLLPKGFTRWVLWQYTSKGAVLGFPKPVDCNRFNGTEAEFRALIQQVNEPPLEEKVRRLWEAHPGLHP